uniref:Uncharacterized protein n=1 Tax=Clastoptera arizonana TaxID=38151 RepID=A0A1B6CYY2_9HEMI
MANNVCLRNLTPVGIIAGLSGGVQGLIGAVLSICVICTYFCALGVYPTLGASPTPIQYLTFLFQGTKCDGNIKAYLQASDTKTTAEALVTWMFLSLFFNVILHVVSVCLVLALWKWKKEKTVYVVNTWTFFSILACLDDVLLTYVFGDIYLGYPSTTSPLQSFTTVVVGFFTARGIFCWVTNLGFIFFMATASISLVDEVKKKKKQESSQLEIIRSWPSLNEHALSEITLNGINKDRSTTPSPTVNTAFTDRKTAYVRTPSMYGSQYPEYSALARWPSLAFNSQTMKEVSNRRLVRPTVDQQRGTRSLREYALANSSLSPQLPIQYVQRNRSSPDGIENLAFEENDELKNRFIRLQSDSGSDPYEPEIPPYPQEVLNSIPGRNTESEYYDPEFDSRLITSENKFETNTMRPKSLHEAIMTRPPLRPVLGRQRKLSSSNV